MTERDIYRDRLNIRFVPSEIEIKRKRMYDREREIYRDKLSIRFVYNPCPL